MSSNQRLRKHARDFVGALKEAGVLAHDADLELLEVAVWITMRFARADGMRICADSVSYTAKHAKGNGELLLADTLYTCANALRRVTAELLPAADEFSRALDKSTGAKAQDPGEVN